MHQLNDDIGRKKEEVANPYATPPSVELPPDVQRKIEERMNVIILFTVWTVGQMIVEGVRIINEWSK